MVAERRTAQRTSADAGEAENRLQSLPGGSGDAGGPVALDRLIHERMRLGIVSALAVNDSLSFGELRDMLSASDGNLSVHARRLEEAGYVACRKSFHGRVPHTEYRLTDPGRRALEGYLDHMESLIQAVRDG